MHAACLFYLLTLFSFVSSYPVRDIKMSPSEKLMQRLSRFVKRQAPQPSSGSVSTSSTFGSAASATLSSPSTNATALSSVSPTPSSATGSTPQPSQIPAPATASSSVFPTLSSATGSIPQPSQIPAATNESQKYVVAHHMVGNTFPYTRDDWAADIALAPASGIRGFALNMGSDSWEPARVADAYAAAEQSGSDFKLFLSLDMSSLPCATPDDATTLRNLVSTYISHPNQLQIESKALVSTFAGESCTFGQSSVAEGWSTQFTNHPDLLGKIFFVPSFFIDPSSFSDFSGIIDGAFGWNSGWPTQLTTSLAQQLLSEATSGNKANTLDITHSAVVESVETEVNSTLNTLEQAISSFIGTTQPDTQFLDGLAALPNNTLQSRDGGQSSPAFYIAGVSPLFFTHYGADSFNKNFIYLSDQHLYAKRWESVFGLRDQINIVEVISWNDFGESDYIGPIKGAQPNSQAWTDNMDHTAWQGLTLYYATAFMTGEYPTIEKDQIYLWSRPHPVDATAPDSVPQPTNYQLYEDAIWAVVMTTAPSTVTLTTSPTTSQTFNVPAGLSKLSLPISAGGTMKGTIERDGQTILELSPQNFTFQANPPSYNFNFFVASAIAD